NLSFNAAANYADCVGATFVRVPSCNTTGLIRTLYPLDVHVGVERVLALMVRRATDPSDSKKGPLNAIEPELEMPSHHGPDVQSVLPNLDIHTIAVKVPTTIMHVHAVAVDLAKSSDAAGVVDVWRQTPRVTLVSGADGVKSTAQIMEIARDLSRNRADLYEVAVWQDGVHLVDGSRLYYFQAVHQESDVVPENVDAIRALLELEQDGRRSIEKTDRALGIGVAK
ncbi:MAG: type II glyceraldehyde-3-phosphate dehydrogenase, partial [Methanobacteriota archaeon]